MEQATQVRAIIFREGGHWIAQCVDFDICAQGATLDDLRVNFLATLRADYEHSVRHGGHPFAGIGRAPERFEEMWANRSVSVDASDDVPANGSLPDIDVDMAF